MRIYFGGYQPLGRYENHQECVISIIEDGQVSGSMTVNKDVCQILGRCHSCWRHVIDVIV